MIITNQGVYRLDLHIDLFYLLVYLKHNRDALPNNYEDCIYSLYEYCEGLLQTFLGYLQ
jgi:hypothetical protein